MNDSQPAYLNARKSGKLHKNMAAALELLKNCTVCPRMCEVDRISGETGICSTGRAARVCSFHPHFGEEAPLVGRYGSGTIFFSYCNLHCCFCQNYEISFEGEGQEVSDEQLAAMMLHLQNSGCHNINFVTPTHVVPQILSAIEIAASSGLEIPLVYNTGGYDNVETLKLLDGIIDIYMPDFKFWDPDMAHQAFSARDYPEKARAAILEMHRQVGDLVMDENGIAVRGLLLRHLVMPEDTAGTAEIMAFIAENVSVDTYVNVMSQYRPCGDAGKVKAFRRRITVDEYRKALEETLDAGLHRLDGRI